MKARPVLDAFFGHQPTTADAHGIPRILKKWDSAISVNGLIAKDCVPMTDPWCWYMWCSMDPINIPQMLAYIPAPWIRHGV